MLLRLALVVKLAEEAFGAISSPASSYGQSPASGSIAIQLRSWRSHATARARTLPRKSRMRLRKLPSPLCGRKARG
jgi:hypothetical protein